MSSDTLSIKRKWKKKSNKGKNPFNGRESQAIQKMISKRLEDDPEKKRYDHSVALSDIGSPFAGGLYRQDMTALTQGSSTLQRIGQEIRPVYLGCRYTLQGRMGAVDPVTKVRVVIFQWNEDTTLGSPVFSDIVDNVTSSDVFNYYNTQQTPGFRILYDAKHLVSNVDVNPDFALANEVSIPAKKLRNVTYNGGASTGTGKLYFMAFSNAPAVGQLPQLAFNGRMKFTDM